MTPEFLRQLEFPWLVVPAMLLGLLLIPALLRFYYGNSYKEVMNELGFGSKLEAQIEILRIALYGQFNFRAVVFLATYVVLSGAIYLMLARVARALA
jgi:hypothetical protein